MAFTIPAPPRRKLGFWGVGAKRGIICIEVCVCVGKRVACVARGGGCSLGKPGAHCVLLLLLRPGSRPAVVSVFCLGVVSRLYRVCLAFVSAGRFVTVLSRFLPRFCLGRPFCHDVVSRLSRCCLSFPSLLSRTALLSRCWLAVVCFCLGFVSLLSRPAVLSLFWLRFCLAFVSLLWKHTVETHSGNTL